MASQIYSVLPEIAIHNGRVVTTSIAVANYFQKEHKNVLQKIRALECSPAFTTANFSAVVVNVQAGFNERETEAYEMTRNGFIFLVMGFTGKKAAAFKEAYIAEFDRLEVELHQHPLPPTSSEVVQTGPRTVVIHLDESGNIIYTEHAPRGSMVTTVDSFKSWMEQNGWLIIRKDKLLERLTG
ncbi:Rha family transcriptional regulator [Yokenella regensburgei]|uniref:Rha family transcriptional regulator n=1 Tax=Yokenella regensburgei TaxID=158877 RepID=UPI0035AFAF87